MQTDWLKLIQNNNLQLSIYVRKFAGILKKYIEYVAVGVTNMKNIIFEKKVLMVT